MKHKTLTAGELQIGDKVRVIDWGRLYSTDLISAKAFGLTNWQDGNCYYYREGEKGTLCTVVGVGDGYKVGILAPNGVEYVINIYGVELVEKAKGKTSTSKPTLITLQEKKVKYSDDDTTYTKDTITFEGKEYTKEQLQEHLKKARRVLDRFNRLSF